MNALDRYVGRIALGAFGVALAFFLFLSTLVDLLNSLPSYINKAKEQGIGNFDFALYLGLYYVKLVPVLFNLVAPFAVVIAGMFTVARLQQANEVVPMLFVGRSIYAVLRPVLAVGMLAALGMVCCWQWVVPQFGEGLASAQSFLKDGKKVHEGIVHEVRDSGQFFYAKKFDPTARTLEEASLLQQGALAADCTLLVAARAVWDDAKQDWRLEQGWLKDGAVDKPVQWLGRPDLTPALLLRECRDTIDPELLSYTDLGEMVQARPFRADIRLAFHHHITWPLACVLLLLLSLPMAVYYERGSRIGRLLWAIGLCGAFVLVDMTCQSLGQRGTIEGPWMHPVMAAWMPTILFGSLGLVLYSGTKT